MSTAEERARQLDLVARLKYSYPELPDAPTPDLLDHARITAYLKPVHDVGGEPDAPIFYEGKAYELWEHMTYVMCEVLAWRGIWLSEERRRIGNVDVGRAEYLGLPYYGRWLLAVARVLVEKHHIALGELSERMLEVQERYAGGLAGKTLEAQPPRGAGDGSDVPRNTHHRHAVASAIRRSTPERPARHGSPSGVVSSCVNYRSSSTRAHRNTFGGVPPARSLPSPTRAPHPRTRRGGLSDAQPEWFYVVEFRMSELWHGYTGPRRRHSANRDPGEVAGAGRSRGESGTMSDAPPGAHGHDHDHDHDHARTVAPMVEEVTDFEVLEIALRELCIEKGLFTAEEHRRFTEFAEQIGPTPAATLVARAWVEPDFRELALAEPMTASKEVGVDWLEPTGFGTPSDFTAFSILADTPDASSRDRVCVVFVLSATDSRQFTRVVSHTELPASDGSVAATGVVGVRSPTAGRRVGAGPGFQPEAPVHGDAATSGRNRGLDREQLAEIITRDCLMGVALPKPGVTTNAVTTVRPAVHPAGE